MKKIAHCIHHTHWDLIWYFTTQDATVQFSYNFKELLDGLESGKIIDFFLDGQTTPVDEYIHLFPYEEDRIRKFVSNGRLVIGPFNSQLDCFISSGESIINNLRLGIKTSKKLGKVSKIAYLPDSFGHTIDFPKIFNQYEIHEFVITRGVGDHYDLGSEFFWTSNDGSKVLVYTMISGYGYGAYGFRDGTLLTNKAEDYNKISVHQLINRLLKYSTLENEFVFPLGFDQNPAILNIPQRIEEYNLKSEDYIFKLTNWKDFLKRVRERGKNIKEHKHELFSTQYHRVHRSIFSARADIKGLQDRCERLLTYELQPLMSMLDSLGIPYNHGLVDKAWETLILCQTHSSATLTDETNDYIRRQTQNAYNLAYSTKIYLMKLVSISIDSSSLIGGPLVVFNTLPICQSITYEMTILTKTPNFYIIGQGKKVDYTIIQSREKNHGVLRKNVENLNLDKVHFETDIVLNIENFEGISYKTLEVVDVFESLRTSDNLHDAFRVIENNRYRISQEESGITIFDKLLNIKIEKAFYLEDTGDEGDSFDYSYPSNDLKIVDYFDLAKVDYKSSDNIEIMMIRGDIKIPSNLKKRKIKEKDDVLVYEIQIKLFKNSSRIEFSGKIKNQSEQHRVRLVFQGNTKNDYSFAGTQFGYIKRETFSKEMNYWRSENWFEEPSATYPLLNHVSMVNPNYVTTLFTRHSKEYELINEDMKDLAITLFRSYGAMGYPDLNRRPGRPSGLDYMIFETPDCQMKMDNKFEFSLQYYDCYNANKITNDYIQYACETSYYQLQNYDKSINPIAYFPTNPTEITLPIQYSFLVLNELEGSFGTIVKSDISDSYILRVYNNDLSQVKFGSIQGNLTKREGVISNLEETVIVENNKSTDLKPGELRIVKFI